MFVKFRKLKFEKLVLNYFEFYFVNKKFYVLRKFEKLELQIS